MVHSFLTQHQLRCTCRYARILYSDHTSSNPAVAMLVDCFLSSTPVQTHRCYPSILFFWSPHQFKSTRYYASILFSNHNSSKTRCYDSILFCDHHTSSNPPVTILVCCFLTSSTVQIHHYSGSVLFYHPHTSSNPPFTMLVYYFLAKPVQIHPFLC